MRKVIVVVFALLMTGALVLVGYASVPSEGLPLERVPDGDLSYLTPTPLAGVEVRAPSVAYGWQSGEVWEGKTAAPAQESVLTMRVEDLWEVSGEWVGSPLEAWRLAGGSFSRDAYWRHSGDWQVGLGPGDFVEFCGQNRTCRKYEITATESISREMQISVSNGLGFGEGILLTCDGFGPDPAYRRVYWLRALEEAAPVWGGFGG